MFEQCSLDFLKRLLESAGPSGFEMEPAKIFREEITGFCHRVETDVMGNTLGVLNPDAPFRVMLAGHYDEIGFQIVHISDEGLLYFRRVGGIDKINVPSSEVEIITETGKIPGIIGKKPIHLLKESERNSAIELEDLWIDIGVDSREEAEKLVSVGDPIVMRANFRMLNENRVMSKGLDDRIGSFIVAETLRELAKRDLKVGVYGVGTVQEELGYRGAIPAAFGIAPQIGFGIDVGFATDLPNIPQKIFGEVKLGAGPELTRNSDSNPVLWKQLCDLAKAKKIPYQVTCGYRASGGTDTCMMQLTHAGAATALIHIPNRYMHSPVEMCDLRDAAGTVQLLTEYIASLTGNEQFRPGID